MLDRQLYNVPGTNCQRNRGDKTAISYEISDKQGVPMCNSPKNRTPEPSHSTLQLSTAIKPAALVAE